MNENQEAPRALRSFVTRYQAELRMSARMTVAAVASYAAGELLGLAQSYWAVLTAIIVMQANIGGSLKATAERLLGTVAGTLWGLVVALTVPYGAPVTTGLALFIVIGPLAILAALRPGYRVAPITGVLVLLSALSSQAGPLHAAVSRVLEIGLGSVIALIVALSVLPARAHRQLAEFGGKILGLMAEELSILSAMLRGQGQGAGLDALRDRRRAEIARVEAVAEEAQRERSSHLSDGPDPRPFLRTFRRLRSDLIIIARAAVLPLPDEALAALAVPIEDAMSALGLFFTQMAAALDRDAPPPSAEAALAALERYAAAMGALRKEGGLRHISDEGMARLFSLAFAFDQLRTNIIDLAARSGELYRWQAPGPLTGRKDVP